MIHDKNKAVAETLGLCRHNNLSHMHNGWCPDCNQMANFPDFTTPAGRVQLLELMMAREDWEDFYWICFNDSARKAIRDITTPGTLLDAVYSWLKGKED